MQYRRYIRNSALIFLLVGLCFNCGDDASSGRTDTNPQYQLSDSGGVAIDPDTGLPIEKQREIILLHDPTVPLSVTVQKDVTIRAKVVDYLAGEPAEDAEVSYEIVENEGDDGLAGDASLATELAYSNGQGEVENTFRAQSIGNVAYVVKLSTDGAEDKFINIYVNDVPKGSIQVNLAYEGPINVNTIKVRLMPKTFSCADFHPNYNLSGALFDKTVLTLDSTPTFAGLNAGTHYSLVATALSPAGSIAAAGCNDGVFVTDAQITETTLTLYLLPLNPTGNYDVDNLFDFTGALSGMGSVGQVLEGVVTLFNDPGKFLIEQIKTLVKQFIGEVITDVAFGLFEDELADVITDWVKDDSPKWLQDFFTIGDDITQVVDNLHLLSVLKISKLSNDYYVQGIQYWSGIVLTWKYGCEDDAPADCGVYTFSMEEFNNTEFPQNIIEGKFTASVVNWDELYIDNHVIMLSYGKLILFVLNEMILKTITGENTLVGAAKKFVDCPKLADNFSNSVLDAIGLPESKLAKYCDSVVGFLVAPLEKWIGDLALDSQLRLSGNCTMLDESDDLIVDKLLDGVYQGTIEVDGGPGPTFVGTWEGVRQSLDSQ